MTSTVPSPEVTICVDFGSTFTKASLVDVDEGRIVASAEHRTTIDTDVLDGYDACLAALAAQDVPIVPVWQGKMIAVSRNNVRGIPGTLDPTVIMRFWKLSKS